MPKQITSYKDWLGEKLKDPKRAARFLTASQTDSPEAFLKALRKVASAQARSMVDIAETVGVSRESLYRMMSESGNPSYTTVRGILNAMGFRLQIVPLESMDATGKESEDPTFSKNQPRDARR